MALLPRCKIRRLTEQLYDIDCKIDVSFRRSIRDPLEETLLTEAMARETLYRARAKIMLQLFTLFL